MTKAKETKTMTTTEIETQVHCFEKAGLGKAPFDFVGCYEDRGPKVVAVSGGITTSVGAPGQPMGVCAYCGMGIAECCVIRSSDRKEFIVGNECVARHGDKGLLRPMKVALNKMRRESRHAADAKRIDAVRGMMNGDSAEKSRAVESLSAIPHPNKKLADSGATMLDWCRYMFQHAGNAGKIKACRLIEKAVR